MKKIYRNLKTAVLALGCMSLLLSSCSDFLDRNPHDFVSPEIFYKNESDCMMALAGVYWTLATDHVYGERYSNILSNTDDLSYYARLNQSIPTHTIQVIMIFTRRGRSSIPVSTTPTYYWTISMQPTFRMQP